MFCAFFLIKHSHNITQSLNLFLRTSKINNQTKKLTGETPPTFTVKSIDIIHKHADIYIDAVQSVSVVLRKRFDCNFLPTQSQHLT
jgi:hypothetical protein